MITPVSPVLLNIFLNTQRPQCLFIFLVQLPPISLLDFYSVSIVLKDGKQIHSNYTLNKMT